MPLKLFRKASITGIEIHLILHPESTVILINETQQAGNQFNSTADRG
jgi:hypothetical protein